MKENKRKIIILICLLIGVLAVNVYYLQLKSGYYVDEGMTLFLANGHYNGAVTSKSDSDLTDFLKTFVLKDSVGSTISNLVQMLKELTTAGNYSEEGTVEWYDAARNLLQGERTWMRGQELFDEVTVPKGERFHYLQVFINQAMDVHPPFYYLLVHTIFSLFAGTYSDWYLFFVNIVALMLTCLVLWKIADVLSDNSYYPILSVAMFGFSQGFISCAMYFRMYAWLTLWVTLTIYLHLLLKRADYKSEKRQSVFFIITVILGFYTHYYYIVFLAPLAICFLIQMLMKHRKAEAVSYIKRCILAGVFSIIIWPLSLYHILFGYRGTEAVSNLVADGFFTRLKSYYNIIRQAFFLESNWIVIVFLTVGIGLFIIRRKQKESLHTDTVSSIVAIGLSCVFYLFIISQIAPAQSDRYIMCLYPMIALVVAAIFAGLVKLIKPGRRIQIVAVVIFTGVFFLSSLTVIHPDYLYPEQREMVLGTEEAPSDMNALMIADGDFRGFPEAVKLSHYRNVIVLEEQQLSILEDKKPEEQNCNMIVYIYGGLDQDSDLEQVCELMGDPQGATQEISSDIMDFKAYEVRWEVE